MSLQNGMWHDLQNGIITRNTIYAERLKVMKERVLKCVGSISSLKKLAVAVNSEVYLN